LIVTKSRTLCARPIQPSQLVKCRDDLVEQVVELVFTALRVYVRADYPKRERVEIVTQGVRCFLYTLPVEHNYGALRFYTVEAARYVYDLYTSRQ
jgi:hypothetical protein